MSTSIPTTNAQLYELSQNEKALIQMLFSISMQPKVKDFWKNNSIRVQTMLRKKNEILQEFFVIENETVKMIKETVDGKEKDTPVFNEGKTMEGYEKAMKELMETENTMMI